MTPCPYGRADTGDRDSGTRFRCSRGHGTGGADSDRDPGSGTGLFDHRIGRASVRIRGPDADARGDLGARDGLGVHQSRRCRYLGGCPRTVRLRLDQEPRLVVVRLGVMPPTDGHAGRNRFWTRDAGHTVAVAGARARARQATARPRRSAQRLGVAAAVHHGPDGQARTRRDARQGIQDAGAPRADPAHPFPDKVSRRPFDDERPP